MEATNAIGVPRRLKKMSRSMYYGEHGVLGLEGGGSEGRTEQSWAE